MLKLPEQSRDEIVKFLVQLVVPATAGAEIMKIAQHLAGLETIKEDVVAVPENQKQD